MCGVLYCHNVKSTSEFLFCYGLSALHPTPVKPRFWKKSCHYLSHIHLFDVWGWYALQLQKTHANRKSTSKSRKHFHHFDSRWCKCSQHKQIKKHTANAHNTTKYILFAARLFFVCVVSICSVCVVKLRKLFLNLHVFSEVAACWALSVKKNLTLFITKTQCVSCRFNHFISFLLMDNL